MVIVGDNFDYDILNLSGHVGDYDVVEASPVSVALSTLKSKFAIN